jgi:integrase
MNTGLNLSKDISGRLTVAFHYNPDLRYIQEILGHKSSKTTEIYTHASTKDIGRIKSPLDSLNLKKGGER